jgi:hypothetical protein
MAPLEAGDDHPRGFAWDPQELQAAVPLTPDAPSQLVLVEEP